MAPRKGMFISNKVKPTGSFNTNQGGGGDFFIKPASRGSTVEDLYVERKKLPITLKTEKKPFDKKKWRMQRYSKKYKVQQWEDRRKKVVLREYYKQIEDRPKFDVQKIYEEEEEADGEEKLQNSVIENDVSFEEEPQEERKQFDQKGFKTNKVRRRAHEEFQRIKGEKKRMKEEALKKKAEKQEAMRKSKEERNAKFKRLNKKTRKGQPIMKERMEMLLEQIQKNLNK